MGKFIGTELESGSVPKKNSVTVAILSGLLRLDEQKPCLKISDSKGRHREDKPKIKYSPHGKSFQFLGSENGHMSGAIHLPAQ